MRASPGQSEPKECSAKPLRVQGPPAEPLPTIGGGLLPGVTGEEIRQIAGLYLHIPFCFHKCHYCDFYSIVDDRDRQAAFTDRLIDEIRVWSAAGPCRPRTIFVGGGTPTLLRPELWRELLAALRSFDLSHLVEFTVEANPETVTAELLEILAGGGVNRMSIGAQSFNPAHLQTLERWHDPTNVGKAVGLARQAGIENVNLDLIFAVPGQTLHEWRQDLDRALELAPAHLSCYSLVFEPNTPLTTKLRLGRIAQTDQELEAEMFACTIDTLCALGFEHYEVSNFARPGRRCEHNLIYWRNESWLALGPSASGHVAGLRWKNVPHLGQYLAGGGPAPIQDVERLGPEASLGEQLMLRLRLLEGVDNRWLEQSLSAQRRETVRRHIAAGLLEETDARTRLTRRGLMLADAILSELL